MDWNRSTLMGVEGENCDVQERRGNEADNLWEAKTSWPGSFLMHLGMAGWGAAG